MRKQIILAIDTSCDETSVAVLENERVFSNVIASQVDLHKKWGGVVPDIAKRAHQENIDEAVKEAMKRARKTWLQIDAIAVTEGPGLAIALEVGIEKAKNLALKYGKPLIAVNHMEGHLLSSLLQNSRGKNKFNNFQFSIFKKNNFPILGILVSGGHTELILIEAIGKYKKIGQTVDDAAGEAFDKFAKMLELGYPGGEIVERLAEKGNSEAYNFPRPMKNSGDLNYSFSGLKTAALYLIRDLKKEKSDEKLSKKEIYDLCASFQEAVIDSLMIKLEKAISEYKPKIIFGGGGVMSNLSMRKAVRKMGRKTGIAVYFPIKKEFFGDNAAMIGLVAYYKLLRNELVFDIENLDRKPSLSL